MMKPLEQQLALRHLYAAILENADGALTPWEQRKALQRVGRLLEGGVLYAQPPSQRDMKRRLGKENLRPLDLFFTANDGIGTGLYSRTLGLRLRERRAVKAEMLRNMGEG